MTKDFKTRRYYVGLIYFIAMLMLVLLRMAVALGAFNSLPNGVSKDYIFTIFAEIINLGIIPIFLYICLHKKMYYGKRPSAENIKRELGFNRVRKDNWRDVIIISLLSPLLINLISYLWNAGLINIGFESSSSSANNESVSTTLLIAIFFVAALPAFFEELMNRGLLGTGYNEKRHGIKFILLSAAMFSLMHQNVVQTGYTFVAGLVLAALFYYTHSIYPAILCHFLNNAIAVLSEYGAAYGGPAQLINVAFGLVLASAFGGIIGALFLIGLAIIIFRCFKRIRLRSKALVPVRVYDSVIYLERGVDLSEFTGVKKQNHTIKESLFLYIAAVMNAMVTLYSFIIGIL